MIWLWFVLAWAHPLAPSVLQITETPEGVEVLWRTPAVRPSGPTPVPALMCTTTEPPKWTVVEGAIETRWRMPCSVGPGDSVGVDGLVPGGPVVLAQWISGDQVRTEVLTASNPRTYHPAGHEEAWTATLELGIRHLLTGWDHLLFVCGLVLAVPVRRLVGAVTAFTVGHAISLGLGGLGTVTLPSALVETGIALTLVWLAAELLGEDLEDSWLVRYPMAVCLPFGLVHGLGFAGAWLESGMQAQSRFGALLGFNLGIELAQLVVVVAFWAVLQWVGDRGPYVRWGLAWIGGAIAGMWAIERALALVA